MKLVFILILNVFLFSCSTQQSQDLPESDAVAKVGDEVISADLLNAYMYVNGIANPTPEMINASLGKLIEEVAMANIATKKQLPMTRAQLNNFKYLKLRALASNAKLDYLSENKSTEQELLEEYNNVTEQTKGQEYHVHHLLYIDEIQAITALDEIKSAEDFKIKEAQYMQENPGKVNVGNLGWLNLLQLPKSFKEVLPQMAENSVHHQVISSQFGAHIIYLEAVRNTSAPAFEEVKSGIEKSLEAKKVSKFAQLAKVKARVTVAQ